MTWATDDIFVAGGDFVADHWREFQDQAGTRGVVVLAEDRFVPFTDPVPWATLWLPVADESQYTLAHFQLGTAFIQQVLAARHKVLLYAPAGMHRTRPLVAAYLLRQGKSLARVLKDLEQRPWLPPYRGQVALLERWATATD